MGPGSAWKKYTSWYHIDMISYPWHHPNAGLVNSYWCNLLLAPDSKDPRNDIDGTSIRHLDRCLIDVDAFAIWDVFSRTTDIYLSFHLPQIKWHILSKPFPLESNNLPLLVTALAIMSGYYQSCFWSRLFGNICANDIKQMPSVGCWWVTTTDDNSTLIANCEYAKLGNIPNCTFLCLCSQLRRKTQS